MTVDVTTPVPIAVFITLIGAALTGGAAGSLLTAWFNRRWERQRQERERRNVLRLLEQWLVAQWETATVLGSTTGREHLDLLKVGDLFDIPTLDALLRQFAIDADEAELKTLFALRRHLALVNRAMRPLIGPGGLPGPYYPTRVMEALNEALPLIEDVHQWLRPKVNLSHAAPPTGAVARGKPADGA